METGARCPYALPASPRASPSFCLGPAQLPPTNWGAITWNQGSLRAGPGTTLAFAEGLPEIVWLTIQRAQCNPGFMLRPHLAGRHMMLTGKHGALHYA